METVVRINNESEYNEILQQAVAVIETARGMLGKSPYTFNFIPTFCADYVEIPGTGTEAMANQMAHADHFSPRRSCIHVFDDRIEFINPGGMPMPLDVMENSFESQPRNPIIAKLFRLAHLSENLGYGLRKLKRWQEVTGRPMRIETTINSVKVIFDLQTREVEKSDVAKNVAKNLTERQQRIITLICENPHTTRAEIATEIGVAVKTVERELANLSDIVSYVGSKKRGHWSINIPI